MKKVYIVELQRQYEPGEILCVTSDDVTARLFARDCPLDEPDARIVIQEWDLPVSTSITKATVVRE